MDKDIEMNFALVCEYSAVTADQKLVLGGVLDRNFVVTTKAEITNSRLHLVTSYTISKAGKYTDSVTILDSTGKEMHKFISRFVVPELKIGENFGTSAPAQISLKEGKYSVNFYLNDKLMRVVPFRVVRE